MEPYEETNGGRHSRLDRRYDLMDARATKRLAEILHRGAITHHDADGSNWRKIPVSIHLNHALAHIFDYLEGAIDSEDHLGHAMTRLHMAVAVDMQQKGASLCQTKISVSVKDSAPRSSMRVERR